MLAIKDFQDQDIEEVLKRPVFCGIPGYENKEPKFYGKNCAEPICISCSTNRHSRQLYAKILLEEAVNEIKADAESVSESH